MKKNNFGFLLVHGPFSIVHVGLNNYQERYSIVMLSKMCMKESRTRNRTDAEI